MEKTTRLTGLLTLASVVTIIVLCGPLEARADTFRLAAYYADHMVLQMAPGRAVVWGYGDVGAQITLLFKGTKYSAVAAPTSFSATEGIWSVTLDPQPPSGPFAIRVTSDYEGVREVIDLEDVLFGDVWVCSGQSNMAFDVKDAFNGTDALQKSYQYPHVRVLAVTEVESSKPLYDLYSVYEPWSLPTPDALGAQNTNFELYFSAVCWFFGRDLYDHMKYPIGLISTNWGGTRVEAWSSPGVMKSCNVTQPQRKPQFEKNVQSLRSNRTKPLPDIKRNPEASYEDKNDFSGLWNAMIHPLLNMTIKGAIWYQGEDNAVRDPSTYNCLFPAMISDWRKQWFESTKMATDPVFPFGFVQLCNSEHPGNANYTSLRWHQTADYGYVPNPTMPSVFMAVSIDLPDVKSPHGPVHPRDKEDVSARLLLGARAVAYNETYTTFQGPFPTNVSQAGFYDVSVQFNNGSVTLKVNSVEGFDICCSASVDDCPIQGNTSWQATPIRHVYFNGTVVISNPCPGQPAAVRYIWKDLPCEFKKCPLYDAVSGLPVPPFMLPVAAAPTKPSKKLKFVGGV